MTYIIVFVGINQMSGLSVTMYRGKTKITNMIRATSLVKQNIPISKTNHTIIEIMDHICSVFFTQLPVIGPTAIICFFTPFCKKQIGIGERLVDQFYIIIHRLASAPWLVPVKANTP